MNMSQNKSSRGWKMLRSVLKYSHGEVENLDPNADAAATLTSIKQRPSACGEYDNKTTYADTSADTTNSLLQEHFSGAISTFQVTQTVDELRQTDENDLTNTMLQQNSSTLSTWNNEIECCNVLQQVLPINYEIKMLPLEYSTNLDSTHTVAEYIRINPVCTSFETHQEMQLVSQKSYHKMQTISQQAYQDIQSVAQEIYQEIQPVSQKKNQLIQSICQGNDKDVQFVTHETYRDIQSISQEKDQTIQYAHQDKDNYMQSVSQEIDQEMHPVIEDKDQYIQHMSSSVKNVKTKRIRNPIQRQKYDQDKHPMLPPCKTTCRKKCSAQISEDERIDIWNLYWSFVRQRRRDFIAAHVKKHKVARKSNVSHTRRVATLKWSLNQKAVCKTMFLNTIGYKNDQVVTAVLKSNYKAGIKDGQLAAPDLRGKCKPPNAFPEDYLQQLKEFILKYNPLPSHYNIKHAPNRKYMPIGVTLKRVFDDFIEKMTTEGKKTCSWTYFINTIKQLNISSSRPDQDKCTKCVEHSNVHPNIAQDLHNCEECDCTTCLVYSKHISNKNESRNHLKRCQEEATRSNGKSVVLTVDMQKVISMPKLPIKDFFFLRKLILFNETFAVVGSGYQPAYCLLWYEAEGGRKAYNIASSYVIFLRKYARDYEQINMFADNCNAQNKNKFLFTALIRYINDKHTVTKTIKLEYLESGHTYMTADSVHASIGIKLNKSNVLYDFEDYIQAIESSRKNIHVYAFDHKEIMLFENEMKVKFPDEYNISNLKIIEFRRGSTMMFVKNDYKAEAYTELNVFKKKLVNDLNKTISKGFTTDTIDCVPKQAMPRGISAQKKADLMKIINCIPPSRRKFIEQLQIGDNVLDLDRYVDADY